MDFEITFSEKRYFIVTTSGDTSPDDVENSLCQIFQRKEWCPGTNILYDNRQENLDQLSNNDVKVISQKFTQFNEKLINSKVALVMPKDLAFGIARMWEANTEYSASFATCVFRSIDEAYKWIEEGLTNKST